MKSCHDGIMLTKILGQINSLYIRIFDAQPADSFKGIIRGTIIHQDKFTVQSGDRPNHLHAHLHHLLNSMGRSVAGDHN